jgi:predicted dehydrogenase
MNIVIIGLGSIAKKHIAALEKLNVSFGYYALRSSVSNGVDIDCVKNIYTWDALPSDIAFAIISNPTNKHTEAIEECVKRNIPLFIEKPISHNSEGLSKLEEKIRSKGLTTYVACNLRFLPVLIFLKNAIGSRRINEVSVYCGSSLPAWRSGSDYRTSYSADETRGGGVHLDLFHELDYICWLFGKPVASKGVTRQVSSLQINAPDFASYLLFYKHFTVSTTLNYFRPEAKRTIDIVFEDEIWVVDLLKNRISNNAGTVIFEDATHLIKDTYLLQMQYFIDCLQTKNATENNFSSSLEILKIALHHEKIN